MKLLLSKWIGLAILITAQCLTSLAGEITLHTRQRTESGKGAGDWRIIEKEVKIDPAKTAVVICDMWDKHWCKGATERVGEMAPRMNEVVQKARELGMFIIHAPSDTMKHYEGAPQRKLAQSAPAAKPPVPLKNWCYLDPAKEGPLPIDDSDGGCDDLPQCKNYRAWSQQIPVIKIDEKDAITDSAEAYNLMQQRGIENVIVMGVHANMCVLGRPFSIRQMVGVGKNVFLMRDMTDTMYNPRKSPFVSHFRGTDLVVEHVEKYWAPTIASVDFVGGKEFRFSKDKRAKVTFLIGEQEYRTAETLPEFAGKELAARGIDSIYIHVSPTEKNEFPGFEKIKDADLLFISVRRIAPRKELVQLIKDHIKAGKPVVGIRTASHAFDAKAPSEHYEQWANFDEEVFGMDYGNHYGNKPGSGPLTLVQPTRVGAGHLILTNWPARDLRFTSHLYKYSAPGKSAIPLLQGTLEGKEEWQAVAWVNRIDKTKVFYTSLGGHEDFQMPAFRLMLVNAVEWCLREGE